LDGFTFGSLFQKKDISLIPKKEGFPRRVEMLDMINEHGTYLPKSILHEDLDRGFLDFVKDELELVVDEKKVPLIDRIITNQNWMQFTQTWNFQDLDKNISLPFLAIVRTPEVKPGKYVGSKFNIPEKLRINYFTVPTWDGQRKGADVYKVPQPVAVDIVYNLKLFCNRMRENNEFNKIVMQTFASSQSYTQINGHYMPIMMEEVSDESVKDLGAIVAQVGITDDNGVPLVFNGSRVHRVTNTSYQLKKGEIAQFVALHYYPKYYYPKS
jgi:hypothetical protein